MKQQTFDGDRSTYLNNKLIQCPMFTPFKRPNDYTIKLFEHPTEQISN